MEQIKSKINIEILAHAYFHAKKYVLNEGYGDEIDWQDDISFDSITSRFFLQQTAWVILNSGMRERVIANKFKQISIIFYNWNCDEIVINLIKCEEECLKTFNSIRKVKAICKVAVILKNKGLNSIKESIYSKGISYLTSFPFIGDITKFHLAKNIGIRVSKPDRHLKRIANSIGIKDSNYLCLLISEKLQENIAVVDIVIWRYASLRKNYLEELRKFIIQKEKELKCEIITSTI